MSACVLVMLVCCVAQILYVMHVVLSLATADSLLLDIMMTPHSQYDAASDQPYVCTCTMITTVHEASQTQLHHHTPLLCITTEPMYPCSVQASVESLQQQLHQARTRSSGGGSSNNPDDQAARQQGVKQAEAKMQAVVDKAQQRCRELEQQLAEAQQQAQQLGAGAAPAAVAGSSEEMAQLQQEHQKLQSQLKGTESKLSESSSQLEQAQQLVTDLQKQLSVQQEEASMQASSLQQQVASLQQQLASQQEEASTQASTLQRQVASLQGEATKAQQDLQAAQQAGSRADEKLQAEVALLRQQLAKQQQEAGRQLKAEVAKLQAELDLRQQEVDELMEQLSSGEREDVGEQLQLERQAHRSTKVTLQEVLQQLQQVGGSAPGITLWWRRCCGHGTHEATVQHRGRVIRCRCQGGCMISVDDPMHLAPA